MQTGLNVHPPKFTFGKHPCQPVLCLLMLTANLIIWIPLLLVTGYVIITFNRLVSRRNACANARAGIDVNLKKRHQLIPNLVTVVGRYAEHEQQTLTAVSTAREAAVAALGQQHSATHETGLAQSLDQLYVRIEAYPDLKADELFGQLMRNLTEAEEQISASRRAFNAQIYRMNNLVQQFPSLFVARLTGFVALASFGADQQAHIAPAVSLTSAKES